MTTPPWADAARTPAAGHAGQLACDVLVVGGGLGGVAAALAALRLDRSVVLTEPTGWLGGQLTVQAVPPDEHPWVESTGVTASYRRLRTAIRERYRARPALTDAARRDPHLNPGAGWVSALCHEPAVAAEELRTLLNRYVTNGRLRLLLHHDATAAAVDGDRVAAVTVSNRDGAPVTVQAPYVIDATELGVLLPLTGCEHVMGAESHAETGEPHAPDQANPLDQQAISWCFAIEHRPGEDHTIDRPAEYTFWRQYAAPFWPGPQLGWVTPRPETGESLSRPLFASRGDDPNDLWTFRRIVYAGHYRRDHPDAPSGDVTLVNWPQIDYWLGPLVGVPDAVAAVHRQQAHALAAAFLYWLQTDAPRPDGGNGYPGMRLRPDITGSADGFAQQPYIREARRIRAECTVTENEVGVVDGNSQAARFRDTVGIGSYRIDLHPSTGGRGYIDVPSRPFEIPLGALLPVRIGNLIAGAKNLGTTHITNGCYRLHPVEWNIGEAAGALVGHCLNHRLQPRQVRNDPACLSAFQRLLADNLGVPLHWPAEVAGTVR